MFTNICMICGKKFETTSRNRKLCYDDHHLTCPDCGATVLWNKTEEFKGCKSCNRKRGSEKRRQTMLSRYGAGSTLESKQLRSKYESTMIKKYGAANPRNSEILDAKIKATNIEKYGAANPMQNKEVAKKSAAKRKEKIDEVIQHTKETWLAKYGVDNVSKCPEIIDKITDTFIEKYGVKRAIDVPEFRQKMINTMMERYNVPWYVQSEEYRTGEKSKNSKTNERFRQLLDENGITYQQEYPIDFKSYDFYLPDIHTVIEIDPSYTHNIIGNHWNRNGMDKDAHLEKSKLAFENNLRCIHVFDWDNWDSILDVIKPRKPIYARNCEILKLFPSVTDEFLSKYHIQGTCRGQEVSLGLVKDNVLYMVMTFGKPRYNKNYAVEILRFATLPGYRVIGGASKLFKYFVKTFEIDSIISYCDLSKFNGDVYEKIGMTYLRSTQPQEIWSKGTKKITANFLRQRGYDQLFGTNYGKGTSNEQLMLENGWLPVYDCGQSVYVYGNTVKISSNTKTIDMKPKGRKPRICRFCGKEFVPNSNRQYYCKGPHYRNCPVCGKEYLEDNFDNLKKSPVACSYECRAKLIHQTKSNKK